MEDGHAPAGAELAVALDEEEEEAAPLVSGRRGAAAAARAATSQTRDLHLLSSAFLFVFLAYHAAQNLQSTVNTDENLGSVSLGLLYTSFTAFSVVGSPVVRRMGSRRALVLGTSGYLLFIAANLVPSCSEHALPTANCRLPSCRPEAAAFCTKKMRHLTKKIPQIV
ncbi:hypothetical protein OsI_38767 [Oryza sativa Indica Group]|uniref:Uncharacterized protein n=2 Tax=Oryza sativa TaxID=4530 RepID=A3CIJ2_ORYSJ|nr:hypothetical protein OsI_38767 [Oryza sativa Indica Group]EAZ20905.1 hypothetical protein OsJ_36544 [Oryza sativa Japonica Group]